MNCYCGAPDLFASRALMRKDRVGPKKEMERGVPALAPFRTPHALRKALRSTAFHAADSGVSPDAAVNAAAVVAVGCVAAAARVSGPTAASVAGAFVPPAAFSRRWLAVAPIGGDPAPAAVPVSGDPAAVSYTAFPAVAGIFCRGSNPRCWVLSAACEPAVRWNGLHDQPARRNLSPVAAGRNARPLWREPPRVPKTIRAAPWLR